MKNILIPYPHGPANHLGYFVVSSHGLVPSPVMQIVQITTIVILAFVVPTIKLKI